MKKVCMLVVIALFALQASAFAGDLKIAVVDLGYIFVKSQAGQHGLAQVMAKTNQLRQEAERTQNALKSLVNDYKKQQSALSLENRRLKELELKRKQTELKELAAAVRQADQEARKELLPPIHRFLETAVKDYLGQQNYDLVVDGSRGAVILSKSELIVTEDVMKYCDAQWKAKGN